MKKFALLHYGFEKPTPEVMAEWNRWFEATRDVTVEHIGLGSGQEVTHGATTDLPFGPDSLTGISIIQAESLDAATEIARDNPFIKSIQVLEVR